MKANELRIGNYLTSKEWGGVGCIQGIEQFDEYFQIKIKGYVHDVYLPEKDIYCDLTFISLTEEWLLKFGFKKINHIHGYLFYTLSESKTQRCHIDIHDNKTTHYGGIVNHCKYVHQLQNLYFALTGEELIINSDNG